MEAALVTGSACWCPIVRLEVWNGAGSDRQKKDLRQFERLLPELPITDEVWAAAYELGRRCRVAGVTAPASDLLIAACAKHHGAELEQADSDFDRIATVQIRT